MNIFPDFNTFSKLAKQKEYGVVPVATEIFADVKTPLEVLQILKNVSKHTYLLESAENNNSQGRYSFLGYDPALELSCTDGETVLKTPLTKQKMKQGIKECIREILSENKSPVLPQLPPFTGGLVGYFSYDYIKYNEATLKLDAKSDEVFQDVNLMLFHKVIAFDHYMQKVYLIINVKTDEADTNYQKGVMELENMRRLILQGKAAANPHLKLKSEFTPLFDKKSFCAMVDKAKHYIKEGDIFQVVLSNRLEADMEGSLLDIYRNLRVQNPSPYMFYFSGSDGEIAGASPETLVKLENGKLQTFPLAGTRRRGDTKTEDAELEKELLADEKERAEHNMLVDLGRNDLGRVSEMGSVSVEKYMEILKFSHVMHIGSTVSGMLREDCDALDAIDAVLPAGTLSGAPKIRACEIINELEDNKRGIYGGAIGYLSLTGNMDTCIAIRLAFSVNNKVFIRSGAGIVADSVPENEYNECIQKAAAVKKAVEMAQEEVDYDFAN